MDWWVYIVNKSGKLDVGITTDVDNRLRQRANPPLLYCEGPLSQAQAASREKQLKGWRREKKLRLTKGEPGMSK